MTDATQVTRVTDTTQATDASQVEAAVEQLRRAMIAGDRAALQALTSEALSFGHGNGRIENQAQYIDGVIQARFSTVEFTDQSITLLDGCAFVRHIMRAARPDMPDNFDKRLAVLAVWLKPAGRWQLVARQAGTLPKQG